MSKNIVICCDGTANEFAENKTNVVKLYSTLVQDSARQVTFYHPGLGTMEPAGALTTFARKFTKLLGMAIGYGLANDIRDAYVFLMQQYEPGDKLYLFGFSRGAYTVRAVASLLHMYGLVRRGNEPLVPYAIRMMVAIQRAPKNQQKRKEVLGKYFRLAEEFRQTFSRTECAPWFVGVWDTVNSVGWVENPLKLPYVTNNPSIHIGRHAVSIDEHRAFFRTHLWRRPQDPNEVYGPKDVKQVWFAGVHCDVGGGYAEQESALSKIPLEWMLAEAELSGLLVDPINRERILGYEPGTSFARPDPNGPDHKSLTGWWNLAEFIPKKHFDYATEHETRRMNLWRRRTIPAGALVHQSVFERGEMYSRRVPNDAVPVSTPIVTRYFEHKGSE